RSTVSRRTTPAAWISGPPCCIPTREWSWRRKGTRSRVIASRRSPRTRLSWSRSTTAPSSASACGSHEGALRAHARSPRRRLHPYESDFPDSLHVPDFIQHGVGHRLGVDDDDADGAVALAAEREVRDVDAMLAEDGADVADHAWLVGVVDHDHRPLERRFHADAVEQHQPRRRAFEDRAL